MLAARLVSSTVSGPSPKYSMLSSRVGRLVLVSGMRSFEARGAEAARVTKTVNE